MTRIARKESSLGDALVEVKVGDETNQVSVKELTRLYGQEKSLTQKSQQLASQKKKVEEDGLKYASALETLVKRAEDRWKPYSEVDFLVASKKMDANDFNSLEVKQILLTKIISFLLKKQINLVIKLLNNNRNN